MNIWSLNRFLLKFLWKVGTRKSKECSPGSNCLLWKFYQRAQIDFWWRHWWADTSIINPVFQNKTWVGWKNWRSLLFWDGQKRLSQPREPPNLVPRAIKDALGSRLGSHLKVKSEIFRSNRPEVLFKKDILRNFAKFTGKRLCQYLFFNKVAGFYWTPPLVLELVLSVC